jgi:DNA-binding NarL/FixJ family response regulator
VLVISSDQRFRTTTSGLMTRRGCTVATTESAGVLRQYAARLRPDVVVIDADRRSRASTCAWVRNAVHPRQPGLVLVDDDPAGVDEAGGAQLVAKWGPAERLFEAIEAASAARVRAGGEQ